MNTPTDPGMAEKPHRGDIFSVLFAGMMAFVLPGFGQMHNAQPNKGLWIFLIFCGATLSLMALASLLAPDRYFLAVLGVSLVVAIGTWVYGILDALWNAWRNPAKRRPWQTIPVYLCVLLFAYLAVFKAGGSHVRANLVEPYRIPSQSMAPGILRGDFLFADKRVNCPGCSRTPRHGDVALFIYPENRNTVFIKRIVGMPGDRIEIHGSEVSRNGRSLTVRVEEDANGPLTVIERGGRRTYEVQWTSPDDAASSFTVPPGHAFMMGDNRNESRDSRRFGAVPLSDVIGVAGRIWLSFDEDLNIRWDRMGRKVQ